MDATGHPVLVGWQAAERGVRSWAPSHAPLECTAPEVVLGLGHTPAADAWAVGVALYEMLHGRNPFVVDGGHEEHSLSALLKGARPLGTPATQPSAFGKLDMPSSHSLVDGDGDSAPSPMGRTATLAIRRDVSAECASLLSAMLQADPRERLGGSLSGMADVRAHQWFRGFPWAQMASRTLPPPFVPVLIDSTDLAMFAECTGVAPGGSTPSSWPDASAQAAERSPTDSATWSLPNAGRLAWVQDL